MFKYLGEKKRQLDNLVSVANGIKDLKLHIDGKYCEILINSQFEVVDICINPDLSLINDVEDDLKNTINQAIKKMQDLIQKKTQEILNSKHN